MVNQLNLGCTPINCLPCGLRVVHMRPVLHSVGTDCGEGLGLLKVTECPEQVCVVQLEMLVCSLGACWFPGLIRLPDKALSDSDADI